MTLKKFSTSFLTVASFLVVIAVGVLLGNFGGVKTAEAASFSVAGWAWSDNIGWIQFNTGKLESVMYDNLSGKFSGYAWSYNIGWVNFDGLVANGGIGGSGAKVDFPLSSTNSTISGWARACAGTTSALNTCSTMISRTDGWDGWMRFDKDSTTNFPTLNSATIDLSSNVLTKGDLSGYVWGGDVVGWVSLNCKQGGLTANDICATSNYKVRVALPGSSYILNVYTAGTGTGTVTSDDLKIDCGGNCTVTYTDADTGNVTLTANATAGSTFAGWSGGGCLGTGTCTVVKKANNEVTATFNTTGSYTLKVFRAGMGTGSVTSNDGKIDCGGNCTVTYTDADTGNVTLTATATIGTFAGWSDIRCSGIGTCTVPKKENNNITATFNNIIGSDHSLTITVKGQGTVSVTPSNKECKSTDEAGKECGPWNLSGLQKLTAKAPFGWVFTGWQEDCSTIAKICDVKMDKDRNVTATFSKVKIIEI